MSVTWILVDLAIIIGLALLYRAIVRVLERDNSTINRN